MHLANVKRFEQMDTKLNILFEWWKDLLREKRNNDNR